MSSATRTVYSGPKAKSVSSAAASVAWTARGQPSHHASNMAHPAARATGSTAHESGTSSHIALGTVPDWIGAIGTTLAFFVAFVVFYLDVSERHRRQASQVTAWFERKAAEAVLHIVNSSDVPVYNIRVYPKLLGQVDEIIEYPVLGPRTDET